MNNRTAAKRYACDRCREQKLRCPRNELGDIHSTCGRCQRLGALCITSGGRPLGRRPGSLPHHMNSPTRSSRRHYGHPPLPSPQQSVHHDGYPVPVSTDCGSVSSGTSTDSSATFFSHNHAPANFDGMLDLRLNESAVVFPNDTFSSSGSGTSHHSHDSSMSATQHQRQFSSASSSTSVPDFDFGTLGDSDLVEPIATSLHDSTGDVRVDDRPGDSGRTQSKSSAGISNVLLGGDSMAFLVGIIGSISRQLAELRNQHWESWDPCLMRSSLFDFDNHRHDPDTTLNTNPWDSTLSITLRFAVILQIMVPAHSPTVPATFSPPNLSIKLMILSTYIQLGDLFNHMLIHINKCLHQHQDAEAAQAAAREQPQFPGPAQRAANHHHIMMMIQVFEHQLHSVERLMGLPADCRLWSRKDAYAGILDQDESFVLTQAVMGQAQETFRSLKRSIDRIQVSLRGPTA